MAWERRGRLLYYCRKVLRDGHVVTVYLGRGKLAQGAHKLTVRTVDAAGKTLNESAALDVAVPTSAAATTAATSSRSRRPTA